MGETGELQKETKELKTTDVLDQLREVFGEDNVVVRDKEREVICKSNLERDQQCSLTIDFDNIEGATEVDELFSIKIFMVYPNLRWKSYAKIIALPGFYVFQFTGSLFPVYLLMG